MHYSQRKWQECNRNTLHPGTPRPNPENFQPEESYDSRYHSNSSRRDTVRAVQKHGDATLNITTRSGKPNKSEQQRSCGLPKQNILPSNSKEALPDFLLWVKNEPFDFGILSPLPCPKIGINILRKIAEYCREKPGHFPELSLNQWSHICKYKIQLTTNLCFTYFHVFDILTRSNSTWTQRHAEMKQNGISNSSDDNSGESWDEKFHKVVKQGYDLNDEFKVDTMQFLLFLYIQHFLRLHKKYLMKSYGDEPWPTAWASSQIQKSNGPGTGANVPEQQHAEFLMVNLPDIIDFLMLLHEANKMAKDNSEKSESHSQGKADNLTSTEQSQYQRIPIDVINALSLILGVASTTPEKEFKTLDECLHLSAIRWKLEYSRYSGTVDKRSFLQWVVKNLKINPWGHSFLPQVSVSVMTGVWDDVECFNQNKIFWNSQTHPKSWYLISGVEKQVLIFDTVEPMSSIKIHRCTNAFIYLPGVYNFMVIQKCHGVTLNLGVTCKVVKFVDCSGITVSGVGRQFIISDVSQSSFHLLTPNSPIVCGSKNHEIHLSPYNTNYPSLTSHMKAAGVSPKIQRWNRPLEIANDGFPRAVQQSNVLPLAPEEFKMLHFPFKFGGSSTSIISGGGVTTDLHSPILGTLPSAYQRHLDYSAEKREMARKEFAEKIMHSEEDTSLIYQITLQRFKKWLKKSGNFEQIIGLRSYQKSIEQGCSQPIVCSKGYDFLSCVTKALKNFFKDDGLKPDSVQSSSCISSSSHRSRRMKQQDINDRVTVAVATDFEGQRELGVKKHTKTSKGSRDENKSFSDHHVCVSAKGQHCTSARKRSSSISIQSSKNT